ncbi:MAG: GTPase [Moorea sp. SIO2I5]|nr:GTPase [Moorena sp. SIO2I5]
MDNIRIVVTGTIGAGKSTFVRTFSEGAVIETERTATDATSLFKKKTTVALDFGLRPLNRNLDLHLYGTPGQARFDFMWDILIRRAHAYILLMAANRSSDFASARQILSFMQERVTIPMIIGLTHTDVPGAWTPEEIMMRMAYIGDPNQPPIVAVNPNNKTSVFETVMILMAQMLCQGSVIEGARKEKVSKPAPLPVKNQYHWPKPQFLSGG